jgi:hypothetical protein
MKMHESEVIAISNGKGREICTPVFRLSGELSEWLFSSRFWSDFNTKHGTMFDQYEEDDVSTSEINALVEALNEKVCALQESNVREIEFVYRWTSDQLPLIARVPKENLISELVAFRNFLVTFPVTNVRLSFSL